MVQTPYPHSAQQMMTNADYYAEMDRLNQELANARKLVPPGSIVITGEQWKEYLNLAGTKDAILNEQRYRSEHGDPTDYIALHEKLDDLRKMFADHDNVVIAQLDQIEKTQARTERKLDDVLSFVDEVKKATEAFANNGGVFSGLLRSILPK